VSPDGFEDHPLVVFQLLEGALHRRRQIHSLLHCGRDGSEDAFGQRQRRGAQQIVRDAVGEFDEGVRCGGSDQHGLRPPRQFDMERLRSVFGEQIHARRTVRERLKGHRRDEAARGLGEHHLDFETGLEEAGSDCDRLERRG